MAESLYEVTFVQPGEGPVTLRVREIADSGLGPTFVKLAKFDFGHGLIINPKQENAAKRYEKTQALHVSRFAIVTVEEIEGPEVVLKEMGSNVVMLRPPE